MEDDGRGTQHVSERREMHAGFCWGNLKERKKETLGRHWHRQSSKQKFTLEQAMKAQRGSYSSALSLTSALDGSG